jgi:hypothetical protein
MSEQYNASGLEEHAPGYCTPSPAVAAVANVLWTTASSPSCCLQGLRRLSFDQGLTMAAGLWFL